MAGSLGAPSLDITLAPLLDLSPPCKRYHLSDSSKAVVFWNVGQVNYFQAMTTWIARAKEQFILQRNAQIHSA